jgi:hypothetical protein
LRLIGNRQQATGNRQQATGNRQQATGNRQQATGNYNNSLTGNVNKPIAYIHYLFSIYLQSDSFSSHYFSEKRRISTHVGTPAFSYKLEFCQRKNFQAKSHRLFAKQQEGVLK